MADTSVHDQASAPKPLTLDVDLSHRSLLRSIDSYVESGSEVDYTTDEEAQIQHAPTAGDEDAGGVIGISISQAQDYMKSPKTPAAEKAQALEDAMGYFPDETLDHEIVGEPLQYESSGGGKFDAVASEQSQQQSVFGTQSMPGRSDSPALDAEPRRKRTSLIGSIFGGNNGHSTTRPRSSSGPMMFGSLRKLLPDLPTAPIPRNLVQQGSNLNPENSQSSRTDKQDSNEAVLKTSDITPTAEIKQLGLGLDGQGESKMEAEDKNERPKLLRRPTSDQSLYLRRTATGASHFDDTSPFADRSDQINSRMKAIADTLADSSLRIPRPTINLISRSSTPTRSTSDLTKRNTEINSGRGPVNAQPVESDHGKQRDKQHPVLNEALSRMTGDVVIMGGYRGSILREADAPHRQLWAPIKIGLNIRKADLEVGLTREDELNMEDKIIPDGTLSHIGPIDISRRLIKRCKKCHNAKMLKLRVHDWGYDWRLSPDLIASRLIKYLEGLECNRPENKAEQKGALVIAHSLGGVITRHVVNKRPELFSGVVYAGVPQHCVNILGPLRNGDDVLLSSKVLTAQVNFTLRTSYALLPETGRCFIDQNTGERYDVDFFNAKTWEEYRLTPCIDPPLTPVIRAPRKSIVGSITESISSYTPSFPSKRLSLFGGTEDNNEPSEPKDTREKLEDARNEIKNTTKQALAAADNNVGRSLEPSMNNTSQKQKSSIATTCTIPRDKAYDYLDRTLTEIRNFKSQLAYRKELQEQNKYPPHAIIYGKHTPTVYGAKVASREAIKYSDAYDNLAFAAGDGVVLASAAQLPSGYRCVKGGRVESERGHVSLLGDLEGIGKCINAVMDARAKGVGMGCHDDKRRKSQA